jgi:predicted RNA binding protein YcfA (HicA-like mRNA interferase family)
MPRKIRELKADLLRAGFVWRAARGSHTRWRHPSAPDVRVTLSGNDGDDADRYQEQDVQRAIRRVQEAKER